MGTNDLASFRLRLLSYRDSLIAAADGNDGNELEDNRLGRLSRFEAIQSQAMLREAERRRKSELQRIEAALRRIEEGDYGLCQSCGEEIAPKRLEVEPATPYCIDCANKSETR